MSRAHRMAKDHNNRYLTRATTIYDIYILGGLRMRSRM